MHRLLSSTHPSEGAQHGVWLTKPNVGSPPQRPWSWSARSPPRTPASAGEAEATTRATTRPAKLTRAVTLPGLLRHLGAFQFISDTNGDNRGSGLPGYDRSADYVAWTMRLAGYKVTRQPFDFIFCDETGSSFAQTAPTPTTYVDGTDYDLMELLGLRRRDRRRSYRSTSTSTPPRASTSGCEAGRLHRPPSPARSR